MLRVYLVLTFTGLFFISNAQQAHNPLTGYGIGDILDNSTVNVLTGGWNKAAFQDRYHINLFNPTSFGHLQSTTLEVGVDASKTTLSNASNETKYWNGNLNYLSLAFPLFSPINEVLEKRDRKLKWGMGIALSKMSNVNYNYELPDITAEGVNVVNIHQGEGGLYNLNYNNGLVYKGFNLGLGFKYTFGNISKKRTFSLPDSPDAFYSIEKYKYYLKGWSYKFGAGYEYVLNPLEGSDKTPLVRLRKISISGFYQPSTKIKSSQDALVTIANPTAGSSTLDTVLMSEGVETSSPFESEYGIGVMYQHGAKFQASLNYYGNDLSSMNISGLSNPYVKSSQISAGISWTPEPGSYLSILKRTRYSAGFRYGTMPLELNGKQSELFGVTVGASIPIFLSRQISFINIGAEYGSKQLSLGYSETYTRFVLGFTLNDDYWFLKRKYD